MSGPRLILETLRPYPDPPPTPRLVPPPVRLVLFGKVSTRVYPHQMSLNNHDVLKNKIKNWGLSVKCQSRRQVELSIIN